MATVANYSEAVEKQERLVNQTGVAHQTIAVAHSLIAIAYAILDLSATLRKTKNVTNNN
jgi:hypothetical protein